MPKEKSQRPRRSRQIRPGDRRRKILRTLARRGDIGPLRYVYRGNTRWLFSDDLEKARAAIADAAAGGSK